MPLSWHEAMVALNGGHQTRQPARRVAYGVRGLGAGNVMQMQQMAQQGDAALSAAQTTADSALAKASSSASRVNQIAAQVSSVAAGSRTAQEYGSDAASIAQGVAAKLSAVRAAVTRASDAARAARASAGSGGALWGPDSATPLATAASAAESLASEAQDAEAQVKNLLRQAQSAADSERAQVQGERDAAAARAQALADERARAAAADAQARADAQALRDIQAQQDQARADRDAAARAEAMAARQADLDAQRAAAEAAGQATQATSAAQIQQAQIAADLERSRLEREERSEESMLQLELQRLDKEEERWLRQEAREDEAAAFDRQLKLIQAGLISPQSLQQQAGQAPMGVAPGAGPYAYTYQQPFQQPAPVMAPQGGPQYGAGIEFAPAFDPGTQMFGMRGRGVRGMGELESGWCRPDNPNLPSDAQILCGWKIAGPATNQLAPGVTRYFVTPPSGKQFDMSVDQATGANKTVRAPSGVPESGVVFYRTPDSPMTREEVLSATGGVLDLVGKAAGYATDVWGKVTGRVPPARVEEPRGASASPVLGVLAAAGVVAVGFMVWRGLNKPAPRATTAPVVATNPRKKKRKGRR